MLKVALVSLLTLICGCNRSGLSPSLVQATLTPKYFLYTAGGTGIFGYSLNLNSGALTQNPQSPYLIASGTLPTLAADSLHSRVLYVNPTNGVYLYAANPLTGDLTLLSQVAAPTNGVGVVVNSSLQLAYIMTGTAFLYVYNYSSGSLVSAVDSPYNFLTGVGHGIAIDPLLQFLVVTVGTNGAVVPLAPNGAPNLVAGTEAVASSSPTTDNTGSNFLLCDNTHTFYTYAINRATGVLTGPTNSYATSSGAISSIATDQSNNFLFALDSVNSQLNPYKFVGNGSSFTPLAQVPAGSSPFSISLDPAGNFLFSQDIGGPLNVYSINQTTGAVGLIQNIAIGVDGRTPPLITKWFH